jgi:hypothetical protein
MKVVLFLFVNSFLTIGFGSSVEANEFPHFISRGQLLGRCGLYTPTLVCGSKSGAKLELTCDDLGVHETEGPKAELQIQLSLKGEVHEYGLRHGIAAAECRDLKQSIQALVNKNESFCILGNLASGDEEIKAGTIGWVFFEFQTPGGSVCDFCEAPRLE